MDHRSDWVKEFLYTLSHDLKEPVNEIEEYINFVIEDNEGILSEESMGYLSTARALCEELRNQVNHTVSYAKAGYKQLQNEIFHTQEVIRQRFEFLSGHRKKEVYFDLKGMPWVNTDIFLFQEIVGNILSNSLKYTENIKNPQISVQGLDEGDYFVFRFSDNGIGVDTRYTQDAWNLFTRLNNGEKTQGTGIGLATVRKLTERLDGTVKIYGKINEGCTVEVRLPHKLIIENPENKIENTCIKIGVLEDASGINRVENKSVHMAYELAVLEINQQGGILGKPVSLIFKDYEGDLEKAEKLTAEMIDQEDVNVLMGGFLSSAREAIRSVADQKRCLYFYNIVYEGSVADHYTFCTGMIPEHNIYPQLDDMFEKYGDSCYIIAPDYIWGFLIVEHIKAYVHRKKKQIKGIEYLYMDKVNFHVTIENIMETQPDFLLDFCFGISQEEFYRQWAEIGNRELPVLTTYGITVSALHKKEQVKLPDSLHFMASFIEETENPKGKYFCEKLREMEPDIEYIISEAESAYSAVYLYKNAVERAMTIETEEVIQTLETGDVCFDGPGGLVTVRGEDHQTIRNVSEYIIKNNQGIQCVRQHEHLYSDYTEQVIMSKTGIEGGIRGLGIYTSGEQYNPMFHRVNNQENSQENN